MSQEADIPILRSFHEDSTSETLSAAAQMNETVSWQLEVKEYHKVTWPTKLTQEIYWKEKKNQESGSLCSIKKRQRTEQIERLYRVSWEGSGAFQDGASRLEIWAG